MPERYINYDLTKVWTSSDTDTPALGERFVDGTNGNEYIFLTGAASTVAGDPVIFDSAYATTRLAGSGVGQVAIALAAVDATTKKGWYLIYGTGSANAVATGGVRLYTSSVTGQLLSTVVTGALIHGMYTNSTNGNTVTGTLTAVRVVFPYVDRASGSY